MNARAAMVRPGFTQRTSCALRGAVAGRGIFDARMLHGRPEGRTAKHAGDDSGVIQVGLVGEVWPSEHGAEGGAELLVELYQRHGVELINHCDGQFAAAVIDRRLKRVALVASWPGGLHSLYYLAKDGMLFFATRIDTLLTLCEHRVKVNERALIDLFRFGGISSKETLFAGIHRVLPGYAALYDQGKVSHRCVWRYPSQGIHNPPDANEFVELYRDVIRQQMSGPQEVGALLSGGLDSTMNVAFMTEYSCKPIKTFSIGFPSPEYDESAWSRLAAHKFHTHHHEITLDSRNCLQRLPDMVWALEQPTTDYSFIPMFFLAEAAKREIDIVIGGDGPDHLLGRGYGRAAWRQLLRTVPGVPSLVGVLLCGDRELFGLRRSLVTRLRHSHLGRRAWLALTSAAGSSRNLPLQGRCSVLWGPLSPREFQRLLSPSLLERADARDLGAVDDCEWTSCLPSVLDQITVADTSMSGRCGVFNKVGTMCAHHKLVVRLPYLNSSVAGYLLGLKRPWKVEGTLKEFLLGRVPEVRTKVVLRRAADGRLPGEVITRRKQGFDPPVGEWLCELMGRCSVQQMFGSLVEHTDWLDVSYLKRIGAEHASGRLDHSYLLMLLATLDQWYRIYVQGKSECPTWEWSECFV